MTSGWRKTCGSRVFWGGYGIGTLARDGSSTWNKYISAIKVKVQVWEKSVASTEKDEKVL